MLYLLYHFIREEEGEWKEEKKLEGHSDWVRDVAWAPSIGLPRSTIASCSQVWKIFILTCSCYFYFKTKKKDKF